MMLFALIVGLVFGAIFTLVVEGILVHPARHDVEYADDDW